MYELVTHAWCGMSISHGFFDTFEECVARVDRRAVWIREQGGSIERLDDLTWEVHENENAAMVPDWAGLIEIEFHPDDEGDLDEEVMEDLMEAGDE